MKGILLSAVSMCLLIGSTSTFADKIMVTGQPVILEQRGTTYFLPENYQDPKMGYRYVTVGDTSRICYLEKNPALASLDLLVVDVQIGNETQSWNCYKYDTEYFEMKP